MNENIAHPQEFHHNRRFGNSGSRPEEGQIQSEGEVRNKWINQVWHVYISDVPLNLMWGGSLQTLYGAFRGHGASQWRLGENWNKKLLYKFNIPEIIHVGVTEISRKKRKKGKVVQFFKQIMVLIMVTITWTLQRTSFPLIYSRKRSNEPTVWRYSMCEKHCDGKTITKVCQSTW